MDRYWKHIVTSTEKRVQDFLDGQVRDASRPDCGRLEGEMVEGKPTVYLLTDCLCLYFCGESQFYKSEELFCAVESGVSFVEHWQREDGSFDFPSCNFYSAPDTAFCFRRLYGAWKLLKIYGSSEAERVLQARYFRLMRNCAPILLHGGFHTPNHRWAVMSALLVLADLLSESEFPPSCEIESKRVPEQGYEIFSERDRACQIKNKTEKGGCFGVNSDEEITLEQLLARAAQYRNEGIDCDEDGEYAERSAGNYNAVTDKCLMLAYEMTGDESLADCVERNLTAMLYYIDGDGTVFTENSTRQDQGRRVYPDGYLYLYIWMAEKTGSELFDAAAHKMIRDNMLRGDLAPDCMYIFMTHDRLRKHVFRGCGYPEEYRRYFRGSEVLRVQNKIFGYSVRNRKAKFLFLKFGSLPLWMRIGAAYCDVRSFLPSRIDVKADAFCTKTGEDTLRTGCWKDMPKAGRRGDVPPAECGEKVFRPKNGQDVPSEEMTENTCTLEAEASGWYYAPFKKKPETADWWKMDHTKREKIITSRLTTKVAIRELAEGLEITVKTEGLSGLPLRLEIGIPAGCVLEHDAFRLTGQAGQSLILKDGSLRVTDGRIRVKIGPGFGTHAFAGHYSGEAKNEDGYSVFLNDYTPCERTLRIERC